MRELNFEGARLAREIADRFSKQTPGKPRFVAGVLGPTNRTASISPDVSDPAFRNVSFDELVAAYLEAIDGLVHGGADLLLVETVFDTLNCKAALFACDEYFERHGVHLPLWVSGTITDKSGRTLSGQTAEAFWNSIRHAHPFVDRAELRARREGPAPAHRGTRRASPTRSSASIPMPACPTRSASTTKRRTTPRACCASSPSPGS